MININLTLTNSELHFLCKRLDECDSRFDENRYMQSLKTKLGNALEESMNQLDMQFKTEYKSEWVGQQDTTCVYGKEELRCYMCGECGKKS